MITSRAAFLHESARHEAARALDQARACLPHILATSARGALANLLYRATGALVERDRSACALWTDGERWACTIAGPQPLAIALREAGYRCLADDQTGPITRLGA